MLGKTNFSKRQVKDDDEDETCSITIHHWSVSAGISVTDVVDITVVLTVDMLTGCGMLTWAVPGPDCLLCSCVHLSWDTHWVSPSPATSYRLPGAVQAQVLVRCHTVLYTIHVPLCHYMLYALNARTWEYSRTTSMVIMVDGWQARQHGDRGPAEECCLGHLLKLYSEHMYTIVQCTVQYSTVHRCLAQHYLHCAPHSPSWSCILHTLETGWQPILILRWFHHVFIFKKMDIAMCVVQM